jgi:anion transporter
MIALIIFTTCIFLYILDRFPLATVALLGCIALVVFNVCPANEAFSGFTNDIIFIVFGTEIYGIAFQESGLDTLIVRFIQRHSKGKESDEITKRIIILSGTIAAVMSAFLNNQVVSALMLVICKLMAEKTRDVNIKDITLPIIYFVIMGGQCTLIGAPATLMASSISEEMTGYKISFFEFLPIGGIIFILGMIYICSFGYKKGIKIWTDKVSEKDKESLEVSQNNIDKRKCLITLSTGMLMLIMFVTGTFTVGIVSLIGALICLLTGVIKQKKALEKIDWNVIIWLGCSIGMANALNSCGIIQMACDKLIAHLPVDTSPYIFLIVIVLLTTLISNLIANTTTVIMILPFAINIAQQFGWNAVPFIISITMAAGLSIMTPLSCGFIGMTMRVGYKFKEYIRYGVSIQGLLTSLTIILTFLIYSF